MILRYVMISISVFFISNSYTQQQMQIRSAQFDMILETLRQQNPQLSTLLPQQASTTESTIPSLASASKLLNMLATFYFVSRLLHGCWQEKTCTFFWQGISLRSMINSVLIAKKIFYLMAETILLKTLIKSILYVSNSDATDLLTDTIKRATQFLWLIVY